MNRVKIPKHIRIAMSKAKKHLEIAIRNREIIDAWLLKHDLSPWNEEIEQMLVYCLESNGTVEELVDYLQKLSPKYSSYP